MASRTMTFFIYYYYYNFVLVLKPWLTFVSEHGNSERILHALVVVKLLPALKHVTLTSTPKKVSHDYECSLPESDARASFASLYIFCAGLLIFSQA